MTQEDNIFDFQEALKAIQVLASNNFSQVEKFKITATYLKFIEQVEIENVFYEVQI